MAKISNILKHIYDKVVNDLLNNKHKVIHSDETTLVVSKKDEANKHRKQSYVYTSSFYKKNQNYSFQESRSIYKTAKWLKNYQGVVECDSFKDYGLFTIVNNGYVEISNNIAEQAVKPFVIQRKVFQTSGSYAGARYTTKLFSIVQTCKINNINVERYFDYVLKNINNEQIENLLPYSSKIKNKIG